MCMPSIELEETTVVIVESLLPSALLRYGFVFDSGFLLIYIVYLRFIDMWSEIRTVELTTRPPKKMPESAGRALFVS